MRGPSARRADPRFTLLLIVSSTAEPTTQVAAPAIAAVDGGTADAPAGWDLESPELYLNRELTWLSFNERVLHEAADARNPLLERVKFLAITAANLDEFFMKRIGGLKQQVVAGLQELTVDGRTPQEQIDECEAVIYQMEARQHSCLAVL